MTWQGPSNRSMLSDEEIESFTRGSRMQRDNLERASRREADAATGFPHLGDRAPGATGSVPSASRPAVRQSRTSRKPDGR